jgi:thiol:disulfide interchange protein
MDSILHRPLTALASMMLCVTIGSCIMKAADAQVNKHLYSESADTALDISAAESVARREHKRILLDFGGNWCGDCQLLDLYYQQPSNAAILSKRYVVVHVDVGHMDHNVLVAEKYHVPIRKGVPALAVLDANGRLVYVEGDKEFEHTSAQAVHTFLERWK